MASFIKRLLSRLTRKQADSRRTRHFRNRRLKLEPMEARNLMASDLGSISGNVFTDLTDNGLTVDDTDLQSVTVWLYRDGAGTPGSGTFQSNGGVAGGDDVLVGTQTTNAAGEYSFAELGPGRYFVEQAPASGRLQRPSERVKTVDISDAQSEGIAVLTIDNFTDNTAAIIANSGAPTNSTTTATVGTNTVGGERDIVVNHLAGANNVEVQANAGALSVNAGVGTSGNAIITYDGVDGNASTIDHTLIDLDLTDSDAEAIQFLAGSVIAGGTINIDVFSGAGNHSSLSVNVPVTGGGGIATEVLTARYSDFVLASGTGADFANVTAIRFQVNVNAGNNVQIDLTQTVAPFVSTQNFANLNPMTVGDRVWSDLDNDGLLDAGETGIEDVTLQIFQDTNSSGAFEPGTDTLVDTTTTNATGNYSFDDLLPGNYLVVIPISNFGAGQALEGFTASTGLSPVPAPNTDINNDNNGAFLAGVGVVTTGALTLTAGGEPDGAGGNSNNRLDFGFAPEIDLAIDKTVNAATIAAGQQVTYTLTVTNNGPGEAENVVVEDNLPNFMTIVSVTANPDGTVVQTGDPTREIEVSYASLPSGATRTITIVAGIPAGQAVTAVATNSASVTGDGIDLEPDNDSDSVNIAVTRNAVLQITKTDTPDPTTVGQPLNYQIVVTNTGPSTATNLEILDTLPAGLTFGSVSSSVGTAVHNAGQITVNVASLNVGSSVTVDIATTVLASFAGSTIANSATADADEAALVTGNSSTNINPRVDLSIVKTDSVDPVNRGGTLTYNLVVTNNGPGAATNVEVVDTLPAGVTFVSATGGTVTPPGGGNNDVTVAVGNIPNGEQRTVTITVTVNQAAGASLTNTAIVRSTETTAGFDPNPGNNSDSETTATQSTIDLGITKADSSGGNAVAPGQTLTYTLVVTNTGPSNADAVRVLDNIPDGIQVTQVSSNTAGVVINTPPSAQDTNPSNPDDIQFTVGNLAVGTSVQLTIQATVLAATRGNLVNTAVVSTTNNTLLETNTANNTANLTTTLTPSVDVAVTKTDTVSGTVIAGNALTYHMDVTNNGPSTANNVVLSDTLPAGVTFVSVSSQQGTASHANGLITANIGTLAPGATVRVTVNITANADARGTLTNTATVTQTETDSNTANNSSTINTTINPRIDLQVTKTKVNPTNPAVPGAPLTYTILVTNNGPSSATSVVMTDVLPNGLTFASGSSTVGTVSNVGQTVTANVGTLAPGASATVTLNANVAASAAGTLANTATVAGTETDTNTTNNSSTLNTDVAVRGSIQGRTYVDENRNGVFDAGEAGIEDVSIALTGTDIVGNPVNRTTTTDADGEFEFTDLVPGTYTVTQTQPPGFRSRAVNVGTPSGGTAGDNAISNIVLTSGVNAVSYNFGEVPNPLSKRRFLASSTEFD